MASIRSCSRRRRTALGDGRRWSVSMRVRPRCRSRIRDGGRCAGAAAGRPWSWTNGRTGPSAEFSAEFIDSATMSTEPATVLEPPAARRTRSERTFHGDTFIDEYAWLADKENPETIAFLEAENAYTEAMTAGQAGLRDAIFGEIKARTQETDLSVPTRKGGWWYYSRTVAGQQYPVHCRRAVRPDDTGPPMSQDGTLLAYSTDFTGSERFTLRIKNLVTGETAADEIPNTFYGPAWSRDGSALFYITVDEAWRPYRVWRHLVGTPVAEDAMVFEEAD